MSTKPVLLPANHVWVLGFGRVDSLEDSFGSYTIHVWQSLLKKSNWGFLNVGRNPEHDIKRIQEIQADYLILVDTLAWLVEKEYVFIFWNKHYEALSQLAHLQSIVQASKLPFEKILLLAYNFDFMPRDKSVSQRFYEVAIESLSMVLELD